MRLQQHQKLKESDLTPSTDLPQPQGQSHSLTTQGLPLGVGSYPHAIGELVAPDGTIPSWGH